MTKRGTFITLEGPEGCGKTTQSARLVDRLKKSAHEVVATMEPGGTKLGEVVRGILKNSDAGYDISVGTEILLFEASRTEIIKQVIGPALEDGKIVVCDRFTDSTVAYQGYGRGFDMDALSLLNDIATAGIYPDITVLIDIDFEHGFKRLEERTREKKSVMDRLEQAGREFHEKVRQGYLDVAENNPERVAVVNGVGEADDVEEKIWGIIADRMKKNHEV